MRIDWHGDDGYEEARQAAVWNLRKPARYPEVIVQAQNEDEVIDAIRLARDKNLKIKVRGTGHNRSASFLVDGGMLLDLGELRELSIDSDARIAVIGPGIYGGDLNTEAVARGLFFPTAHEPFVGLGGFAMTGGYGWCVRRHGLGCANLRAIDVVTADGELIHSDDDTNPDFVWAARGGGPGLFGAVVRFHLDLHPLPKAIRLSNYVYPMEDWEEVYRWADAIRPSFSRDLELYVSMPRKPGGPAADEPVAMVLNATAMSDSDEEALAALEILEHCPVIDRATVRDFAMPKTVAELFTFSDTLQPAGYRYCLDNMVTSATPDDLVPALTAAMADIPNNLSHILAILWHHPPGVPNAAWSVHGTLHVNLVGVWTDDADEVANLRWATEHARRMEPLASGTYVGEAELVERPTLTFLSPENHARYEQLRAKHDPDGVFHPFTVGSEERAAKREALA